MNIEKKIETKAKKKKMNQEHSEWNQKDVNGHGFVVYLECNTIKYYKDTKFR